MVSAELNSDKTIYESRLTELLKETPIVDTHNDFPYILRVQLHDELHSCDFDFNGELQTHTSLPKFRKGKLGVQFFSVYIECKDYITEDGKEDFNKFNSAVRDTLEQIDVTKRLVNEYSDDMKFVNNSIEAMEAYKNGKIAVTLGVEGLHQVDLSLGVLREYFELGCRYITLTHNGDNPFATAASSIAAGLPDNGLTEYGKRCILEMNRLGMMVDLSHVSYKTMLDTLEVTQSPVIFSHSSAYHLTNHERNVRDDVLLKIKENDGVVCVNFYPAFIVPKDKSIKEVSIEDAVNHILHIVKITGSFRHVGFGSDFDGIPFGPIGLEDVSKYPDLIYKIMQAGATDQDIKGLMGGNTMRVWAKNEEISKKLIKKLGPKGIIEDNWKQRVWEFNSYSKDFPRLFENSFDIHKDSTIWKPKKDMFTKK
ncbi:hypothetical protein PACTADRAFT_51312 [Pachysolen tannophilus NRRL Y-2460]|uniref:Dipeptidase n=1 Tax=Pachysolen tannophilus NRRL Y-2460 TaxID=669874 RepID=A0A1E4TRY6_PACTA|nr:hypothetical protein PACTADRAFT_51312 [Pachysolen tannophilus NRRL Y-2460]